MMFGALFFDREPLRYADLPGGLYTWVQAVGGFALLGILLWLLLGLSRMHPRDRAAIPSWQLYFFGGAVGLSVLSYVAAVLFLLAGAAEVPSETTGQSRILAYYSGFLFAGGFFALLAVGLPVVHGLFKMLPAYGLRTAFRFAGRSVAALPQKFYLVVGVSAIVVLLLGFLLKVGAREAVTAGLVVLIAPLVGAYLVNVLEFSFSRVWALARLSFKEAIRRRVLYAFSALLIVFLFASWYIPSKPEDQVRTYVQVFYRAMGILLLFTAVLLSAFSIPTDIKQQTIHTIVTKPVERFEVVLGRFFGFLALMTLVLLVMTTLSLLFVIRGVNPEAAAESLKAREPLYGDLRYENTDDEHKAVNVGREWDYRSYITRPNPGQEPQTARWDFRQLPSSLANRDRVLCEYTFDVYRTTKGKEGAEVSCTFKFYTWRYRRGNDEAFRKERGPSGASDPEKDNALAEKYGYYEINSLPVVDYHTQNFHLPGGLFRNALGADPERDEELRSIGEPKPPPLRMRVTCDSATQYVGMARSDLYIRLDDTDRPEWLLFSLNFFKAAFGLWLRLALVIGLAVVFSTHLSGVITLLLTLLLYIGGVNKDFITDVALGRNVGGGPMEAFVRITRRELTGPSMSEGGTTGERIVSASDDTFRWLVRRVLDLIPDVDRYNLTPLVAEGFNISTEQMVMSFLLLAGYLIPWMVLAFFLIKWREVANPN